jgi:O-acetyl-ADP-ribose deacetylase (regulator of RNase III)
MRKLIKGDITKIHVDVIVNAANNMLSGGGGVDGAIHNAAGNELMEACKKIGFCKTGEVVVTDAYQLPAKYVFHTVGPVWEGGSENEKEQLKNCYINALTLAMEMGCKSISFPNISTGIYGFPMLAAAELAIDTILEFLKNHDDALDVQFVCFDDLNYAIYQEICYSKH